MKKLILSAAAVLLLPFWGQAGEITAGSVPGSINYQGRLERDNAPITGTIHLYFRVYNSPTANGAGPSHCGEINQPCLWQSPEIPVEATQGVFSATLDFTPEKLLYIFSGAQQRYLEVQVESDVLSPREPMNSVAYALVAKKLEDGTNVNFSTLTATYGVMLSTAPGAYMTVGTNSPYPTSKLTVSGDITLSDGGRIRFPNGSLLIDGFTGTNSGAVVSASNVTVEAGTNILFGIPTVAAGEKARITSSGDFGIGTKTPQGKLDVAGDIYLSGAIHESAAAEVNIGNDLYVSGGKVRGTGDNYISLGETPDTLIAATANTPRLWLDSSGNLGVGAAAPASERIYASGNLRGGQGVRGGDVSIGAYTNAWTGAVNEVRAAGGSPLLLQYSTPYNVGIGTNTPTEKLHVHGSVLADYGVRASTGVFTGDVTMTGNFSANGNNKNVYLTTTTVYGTLTVTGGIGSAAGFPAYIASTQTFTGLNTFENQVEVSSDILTINRIGAGVTTFNFPGAKYLQVGDGVLATDNALAYLVSGLSANSKLNFYRGPSEAARLETQGDKTLALVVNGQTKTYTDATYHRIQNSVLWVSTGFASTPAVFVSSYAGSVAMGTVVNDPNWRLTVEGNLRISTTSSPGQSYGIIFADGSMMTTANQGSALSLSNNGDAVIQSDADRSGSGNVLLRAGSLDGLILNSGGNVGIGTVNPISKLNVRGGDLVLGAPVSNTYSGNNIEDLIVAGSVVFDGALVQRSLSAVELSNLVVAGSVYLSTGTGMKTAIGSATLSPNARLYVAGGDINIDSGFGLRVNETAPVRQYLRGDGSHFVPSLIYAQDLPLSIVRTTTTFSTTLPLENGGDFSMNRTLTIGGLSNYGTANYVVGTNNGVTGWEYKQLTGTPNEINITHTPGGIEIGIVDPLIVGKGGTGLASLAQGSLLYGAGTNTMSVLAKDINPTRYLANTGASNNPVWNQVELTNGVSGILPVANGGTGTASTLSGVLIGGNPLTGKTGAAGSLVKWGAGGTTVANGLLSDDGVDTISANNHYLVGLKDPLNDQDAATRAFVLAQTGGTTGSVWSKYGNTVNSATQYMGSNNYDDVIFKTSGLTRMTLTKDGALALNTPLAVASGGTGAAAIAVGVVRSNGASLSGGGTVALGSEVSGTLPVTSGGTGRTTLGSGEVLIGNGTSGVNSVPGAAGTQAFTVARTTTTTGSPCNIWTFTNGVLVSVGGNIACP